MATDKGRDIYILVHSAYLTKILKDAFFKAKQNSEVIQIPGPLPGQLPLRAPPEGRLDLRLNA